MIMMSVQGKPPSLGVSDAFPSHLINVPTTLLCQVRVPSARLVLCC